MKNNKLNRISNKTNNTKIINMKIKFKKINQIINKTQEDQEN